MDTHKVCVPGKKEKRNKINPLVPNKALHLLKLKAFETTNSIISDFEMIENIVRKGEKSFVFEMKENI